MAPVQDSSMISDPPPSSRYIDYHYYDPAAQLYAGLWCLWFGATAFLALRVWCKITRRHGLWYDDYILILSWMILMSTDIIITVEYATGYSKGNWSDHMHILINTSSDGTVVGQTLTKTAFAVTLLRMTQASARSRWPWQQAILWFCIISMNGLMLTKGIFQWAKLCGNSDYQQWYRIQGWCLNYNYQQNYKEVGNIYNIIMDFIFAIFPWFITWPLNLKRAEKIGLCITLSLGMLIAIITAVRTWWKDTPLMHKHDHWYIWRDAISEIWYSAEVAGTIIVQCIPVLRPFIKDLHTSLTSKRLDVSEPSRTTIGGSTWRGSTLIEHRKSLPSRSASILSKIEDKKSPGIFELMDIPEEPMATEQRIRGYGYLADAYYEPNSDSSVDLPVQGKQIHTTRTVQQLNGPLDSWPLPTRAR
ncbi:hypothetical protein VP1G_08386 [Cytospora mali]|uniref:Rhodopsin domain-containing protein n=1 Tax=Cytospora mali TaxID=578113 RepID=A0A194VB22_CYTMA|nr:hypothetical protein VP1G_08386 [Valsa mali var. pyri (nom. inval.)]